MKKLYIHVGLPKTGTTFLQEVVFPDTSFYYLGKKSEVSKNDISDPFLSLKYLQNADPGVSFAEMKVPSVLTSHLNFYREIISDQEELLLSDELITGNPLLSCMGPLLVNCTQWIANINDPELCFRRGISYAEYLIDSGDQSALEAKRFLSSQNTISLKIQRFLDAFDAELGGVLLIKRDFGSWFTSLFLQYIKINGKYPDGFTGDFTSLLVFAAAGFAFRWDYYMRDHNCSGFALGSSFSRSIQKEFGESSLTTVEYSSSKSVFSENLKKPLERYGINGSSCEKINRLNLDKNITKPYISNKRLEHQVYDSRHQISRDLNALIGTLGGLKVLE